MSVATSTAIGIAGAIGAAGSVATGVLGSNAANNAANTQANAATQGAKIQAAENDKALALQQSQFDTQQQNIAPWLQVGRSGLANLAYLSGILPPTSGASGTSTSGGAAPPATADPLANYNGKTFSQLVNSGDPNVSPDAGTTQAWQTAGLPFQNITTSDGRSVAVRTPDASSISGTSGAGPQPDLSSLVNLGLGTSGSLLQPFTEQFKAPTDVTEQNDPGYMFRLQQGAKVLQNSAAARGDLLSGATAKGLEQYGQDYASNEYGNVYNRALGEFQQRYNIDQNNQTNTYNRLASLAGVGQQAASQLNSSSQNYANAGTNVLVNSGNQQADAVNNAAYQRGSGYINSTNALGGAINSGTTSLQNLLQLKQLYGSSSGSLPAIPTTSGGWDQYYGYGG